MERGIQHARALARINAPQEMIDACIASQGKTHKENNYAIDEVIRVWLKKYIIIEADAGKYIPVCIIVAATGPAPIRLKARGILLFDFRQAKVFWVSGTFSGGISRLCRTERSPFEL